MSLSASASISWLHIEFMVAPYLADFLAVLPLVLEKSSNKDWVGSDLG